MALWDKLKTELDRAGRVAQGALDEGKVRLEVMRVRQLADKAAQALGYAVYNSRQGGGDLDAETYARLSGTLAAHEAEAARLDAQLAAARASRADDAEGEQAGAPTDAAPSAAGTAEPSQPAGTPSPSVDPAMGDTGSRTDPRPPGASTYGV